MARTKTKPSKLRNLAKVQKALALRMAGVPWRDVAAGSGYGSGATAFRAVMNEVGRQKARMSEDIETVRAFELARLDKLLAGLWLLATRGNVAAVDRVVKVMERRAKLLGLDAPARQEITGADGAALAPVIYLPPEDPETRD